MSNSNGQIKVDGPAKLDEQASKAVVSLMAKAVLLLQEQEKRSDQDGIWEKLQTRRNLHDRPVPKPEPIITIKGEDGKQHIISTPGNLTVFSGYRKVGKSAVFQGLIAGTMALPGDFPPDCLGFSVKPNRTGMAVIHVDTEQSDYDGWRFANNAERRAFRSQTPGWFHSYNLRPYSPKERFQMIELIFSQCSQLYPGIHTAFIDGAGDLVDDPNDPTESNEAVSRLEKLAVRYNCPIVTALHLNPGSAKMRGHLGSQLERKAESIFVLVRDQERDVTRIQEEALRNAGGVPVLEFEWSEEKNYHVFKGTLGKAPIGKKKRTDPAMYTQEEHRQNVQDIFYNVSEGLKYSHIKDAIQEVYQVSEKIARDFLSYLIKVGLVITEGKEKSTLYLTSQGVVK